MLEVTDAGSPHPSFLADTTGRPGAISNGGTYLCLTAWRQVPVTLVTMQELTSLGATGPAVSCSVTEAANRVIRMSNGRAWWVDNALVKHEIGSGGTNLCFVAWKGAPVIDNVSQAQADALATGGSASCSVPEAFTV